MSLPTPSTLNEPTTPDASQSPCELLSADQILARVSPTAARQIESAVRRFTPEQRMVLSVLLITGRCMAVKSTAGSGKSTLLRVIAVILRDLHPDATIAVLAFNKSISGDLKTVMPSGVIVDTMHAYGRRLVVSNTVHEIRDSGFKKHNIIVAYLKERGLKGPGLAKHLGKLVELSTIHLKVDAASLHEMAEKEDLNFPEGFDLCAAVSHVHAESLRLYKEMGQLDFLDMLYLPIKMRFGYGSVDYLLIDEGQDLSELQHRLAAHLAGQRGKVVLVGDQDQGIYGFSGASRSGMDRASDKFRAVKLALTVTFRCPKRHVKLASRYSDQIRAADHAEDGTVTYLDEQDLPERLTGGDLVICRTNAPLISLALTLMQRGQPVNLLGMDIRATIGKLLDQAFPVPFTLDDIEPRLYALHAALTERHFQNGLIGKTLRNAAELDNVTLECVAGLSTTACYLHGALGSEGPKDEHVTITAEDVLALLDSYQQPGEGQTSVKLCTIHKSKGLEAHRVCILNYDELDEARGDEDENRAIAFVAYTRAKSELLLVRSSALAASEEEGDTHPPQQRAS